MTRADEWIKKLKLVPHPEGGWFIESYRSGESIAGHALPGRFSGPRSFSTAIYFLLKSNEFSAFHKIKQDETWHFYDGSPVLLHLIDDQSQYFSIKIGNDPTQGILPQFTVPAGWLFAAEVSDKNNFSLVGCTVAPGFDFADFEMPSSAELLQKYPQYNSIILELSRK